MGYDYPFHSHNQGIGVADVYHSHPACQIAHSIPLCFRLPGNPHEWPECACCAVHFNRKPHLPAAARVASNATTLAY